VAVTETEISADPKRVRILEGAMKTFLAYGYSRTTMDDIARAADMSRPALYLLFKNKTDIYRAIAQMLLDRSAKDAEIALSAEGSLGDRMSTMIETCVIAMMQAIAESPHGAEIVDMKSSLAGDLAATWRGRLSGSVEQAIGEEAKRNRIDLAARGLSAKGMADMLLDGLEGIKMRLSDPGEQRKAARGLVRVIELSLEAGDEPADRIHRSS